MQSASRTSEYHVLIIDDGNQRRVLQLDAVAYSVGRDPSNAIVLKSDPAISRQHALLIRLPVPHQGYRYRILDGNSEGKRSANGVFINGTRQTMHELSKGDRIQFGKHIHATYLQVAMGEVDFVNYLEALSYQSLKSDVTDAKATLVSPEALGLDEYLMQTMILTMPVPSIDKGDGKTTTPSSWGKLPKTQLGVAPAPGSTNITEPVEIETPSIPLQASAKPTAKPLTFQQAVPNALPCPALESTQANEQENLKPKAQQPHDADSNPIAATASSQLQGWTWSKITVGGVMAVVMGIGLVWSIMQTVATLPQSTESEVSD